MKGTDIPSHQQVPKAVRGNWFPDFQSAAMHQIHGGRSFLKNLNFKNTVKRKTKLQLFDPQW